MKDGASKPDDISSPIENDFKLYKYRWFILLLFCSYACVNFMQYTKYTIITNIIAKYYDIGTFAVSWTILVFMLSYIVLCFPASYLIEKYDLRKTALLASTLTACGIGIRLFSVSPDRYYLVLIGQTLVAIAQVFIQSLPSKVAATWFGRREVSTACAIGVFGIQLGVALGCVISSNVVKNHDDIDLIGKELFTMIMYDAIIGFVICFLIIFFYEAKPRTPPNYSQMLIDTAPKVEYLKSLKNLALNRDYLLLLVAIGISIGLYNTYSVHANTIYLNYFPDGEKDIGLIGMIGLLSGGCCGGVIFGHLLDRTHKFKLITFCLLFVTSIAFLLVTIFLNLELRIPAFIALCVFGFLMASLTAVGFEYTAEVTYPGPQATVLASLNAVVSVFGIIFSVVMGSLFKTIGFFYTNITITCLFCFCSIVVTVVSGNLRRTKTNQMARTENAKDTIS